MTMKRNWTALVLTGALLCSLATYASAAEGGSQPQENGPTVQQEVQALPHSVLYYGQVEERMTDEQGALTRLLLRSEQDGAYIMNLSQQTVWIDAGNRTADDPADLVLGEWVYVFHSPVSTRSLPPQSAAFAVVRNMPQDMGCPQYHVVEEVSRQEDGSLRILTDNGGLFISMDGKTGLNAYTDGQTAALEDIQAGDRIMAWYDMVMLSYPGQTYASHVMLLPGQQDETPAQTETPAEGAALTLTLDGRASELSGRYEQGTAMVPVAAVAQALGLQVAYTDGPDGQVVTVDSDTFSVRLYLDRDLIYGTTKIEGAMGTTGPQDYGKAAYVVSPGTTWAPAQLFTMLGKTVTLDGCNLSIQAK